MNNALQMLEIEEVYNMPEEKRERFKVTDKDSANWCLRKIKALKQEIEENKRIADAEIQRIQSWLKEVTEPLERSIQFFESLLIEYHMNIYAEDPSKKTIKLPYGTLKARAQQPEFCRDDEKLVNWLKQNGMTEFVKVIEKPEWNELKKKVKVIGNSVVYEETGEVIDGITVQERPPKFTVEVE
ncbi:MAG TPA: hypothetical protein DEF39_11450 [Hungateiclostridium thermocellum]|uniref:Bacteriophage Mu Gam like protein n=1 Tax=Acetivibrio thermocellus (strain ATCC 27405 / DSM 1237 / JCM 9322 / NBRC 103400 / NCIMB 10682 / NRRL B-4536 / VPI 7372) TaxID=203119 RepID=A3DI87_ACET2|nr:host-nuclease inhibitor Gam family protein [Acetivibrio thermocellus]ABN53666.1 hypothetical protein Cthe_2464 [Acetivibrio thermocellus ATCC 27405]HBW27854.1 hypothetical protein [Acetivibrio thermocellus]